MHCTYRNIIVVGASYVGLRTAQELVQIVPKKHRVLLLDRHTHFNHIFSFPRFSVLPGHEHKAFVPLSGVFSQVPNPGVHQVINASVTNVTANQVCLDRKWEGSEKIDFDYLAVATGTQLAAPAMMSNHDKAASIQYLRQHQGKVKLAAKIAVIGGGAVGVQVATDLKEIYPFKDIALIHSKDRLLAKFHPELHRLVGKRLKDLGVKLILENRVQVPPGGFQNDGRKFDICLSDETSVEADFVIMATGQAPNTQILRSLPHADKETLINTENGLIRVQPTMQLRDSAYPHIFAVGDVADTNAAKAARPGYAQAEVAAKNIKALIEGQSILEHLQIAPAAIHLSLGLNVAFRNPEPGQNHVQPRCKEKHDGQEDLNVSNWWQRLNVPVTDSRDYNL